MSKFSVNTEKLRLIENKESKMERKGKAKRALAWVISVAMCVQVIFQYPIFVHASEMQQDDKVTEQTKEEEQVTERTEKTEDKEQATEQPKEEVIEDLLITQNTVFTEDRHVKSLKITSGELHLNGHHLLVEGNMLQSGGSVFIDGGELEVKGDYKIIGYTEQGAECSSSGYLYMRNEDDSVKVDGSFVMGASNDHSSCLTNGTLYIKRNLEQKNFGNARNFATSEQFTVCLCGKDEQTLQFANPDTKYSHIANLEIKNSSGKVKANNAVVTRKIKDNGISYTGFLVLGPDCEADGNCIHGSVLIKENKVIRQALEVTGNFEVRGGTTTLQNNLLVGQDVTVEYATLDLNGYTMRVNRHTWLRSVGWLIFNNGKYYNMGTFFADYTNIYITSKMTMNKSGDYLYVGETYRACNPERYDISDGTIEIKGNFFQIWTLQSNNFTPTGNNKVIMSGDKKQKIEVDTYFGYIGCRFNQLILTQPLSQYEFCSNNGGRKVDFTQVCSSIKSDYSDHQAPSKVENLIYSNYSATKVLLTWDESTDNVAVAKYQVWRDGVQVATVTSPQYMDNSIKPGVRSFYRIYAVDEAGNVSTPSDSLTVLTNDEQPPSIPSGVKIKTMTGTSITIQWNPSLDNGTVEEYRVFRDGEYIGSTCFGTTYKDCGLKENKYYTYAVSAIDSVGNESELSKSVKGIVRMPEIYRVSPVHNTQIGGKSITLSVDYVNYGASVGNQVQYEYKTPDGWKKINSERLGQHVVSSSTLTSAYVWNLNGVPNGKCDIRCTLYDEDENTYVEEVTYFVDTIGPETPTEVKANTLNSTVTVSWDPSDSVDCIKYHITVLMQ